MIGGVKTDSSESFSNTSIDELVVEQPRGRFQGTYVRQAPPREGKWCCDDFCGWEDKRLYVGNTSYSQSAFCCCFHTVTAVASGATVVAATVTGYRGSTRGVERTLENSVSKVSQHGENFMADMRSNFTPRHAQRVFPESSPPRVRKAPPPRPPEPKFVRPPDYPTNEQLFSHY